MLVGSINVVCIDNALVHYCCVAVGFGVSARPTAYFVRPLTTGVDQLWREADSSHPLCDMALRRCARSVVVVCARSCILQSKVGEHRNYMILLSDGL